MRDDGRGKLHAARWNGFCELSVDDVAEARIALALRQVGPAGGLPERRERKLLNATPIAFGDFGEPRSPLGFAEGFAGAFAERVTPVFPQEPVDRDLAGLHKPLAKPDHELEQAWRPRKFN